MDELVLYRPGLEELSFRERRLGDPETMACDRACGGTPPFPGERWADWFAR